MMANAKCLRIAAALSVSEAAGVKAATGRNDQTGALCMDRAGLGNEPSHNRGVWSQDHGRPRAGRNESTLPGLNSLRSCLQNRLAWTYEDSVFAGPPQIAGDSLQTPGSRWRRRIDQTRQRPRSLSYLSLTLWCVAPRSGWLGSCASPPQGQSKAVASGTKASSRSRDPEKTPSRSKGET